MNYPSSLITDSGKYCLSEEDESYRAENCGPKTDIATATASSKKLLVLINAAGATLVTVIGILVKVPVMLLPWSRSSTEPGSTSREPVRRPVIPASIEGSSGIKVPAIFSQEL